MKKGLFKDKILLITGGTGSFGNKVLERFLRDDIEAKEIRIFSRDEKKQDDMRKKYADAKLRFFIGDVRDKASIEYAMSGVDYVFHAAALKQVPSCEFFPMEAVKTNIYGTENVLNSAIRNGVKKVICLSTDKAAYPINAMGMSKAMMEKVVVAKSKTVPEGGTVICLTRYGNVMGSRGSVIPLFTKLVKAGKPVTITAPDMTRFMMTLGDAVDLVLYAFEHGKQGELFVQKAPAATIETLAVAISEYHSVDYSYKIIGVRHGEKDHEVLVTREEMTRAKDLGNYFLVSPDDRDLNYSNDGKDDFYVPVTARTAKVRRYSSDSTTQLDTKGVIKLLKRMEDME
ncbi:polysaccharide biosynthesis protein [Candidatus Saccharibacteria bacterium]|nr:polysaccharide biosynthesis protein [Candidatus Saccharibacteria bacterium]